MIVKCLKRKTYFQASTRLEKNRHSLAFQKKTPWGFHTTYFLCKLPRKISTVESQWIPVASSCKESHTWAPLALALAIQRTPNRDATPQGKIQQKCFRFKPKEDRGLQNKQFFWGGNFYWLLYNCLKLMKTSVWVREVLQFERLQLRICWPRGSREGQPTIGGRGGDPTPWWYRWYMWAIWGTNL